MGIFFIHFSQHIFAIVFEKKNYSSLFFEKKMERPSPKAPPRRPLSHHPEDAIYKYKAIFMGDAGVGKTSLLYNISRKPSQSDQQTLANVTMSTSTIGIDFFLFHFQSLTTSKLFRFQLWDTAGQERFESLVPSYIKMAHIVFLVFSFDSLASFASIPKWVALFRRHSQVPNAVIILIGNKTDLRHDQAKISDIMIRDMMRVQGIDNYFKASALELAVPVTEIFESAAQIAEIRKLEDATTFMTNTLAIGGGGGINPQQRQVQYRGNCCF